MNRLELHVNENITLKVIGDEEIEPIFHTIDNEREYLGEWLPFVKYTQQESDTEEFIHSTESAELKDLTFAIYYQKNFVGIVGLKDPDYDNKKVEIGYWLSEKYQHKGIMTLSAKRLIQYAIDELQMNRIQLKAATGNLKSQRIAERLDFTYEGIERDGELHAHGFVDLKQYSLLKKDIVK